MHRIQLTCFTLAIGLVTVSCGGSDDAAGSGDVESFCAALAVLEDIDADGDDLGPFVEGVRDVDDAAPAEVAADTAELLSFIERSAEIADLTGEEQLDALVEFGALEADFDAAAISFEAYARANCSDLEESFFGS